MNTFRNYISESTGLSPESVNKFFLTIVFIVLIYQFQLIILRIVWSQTKKNKNRYQWKRTLSFILPFFELLNIGAIWIQAFHEFGAFLGLFSAGLAIALKYPLSNLMKTGSIFLKNSETRKISVLPYQPPVFTSKVKFILMKIIIPVNT